MLIMYLKNVKHVYKKYFWCIKNIYNVYEKVDIQKYMFKKINYVSKFFKSESMYAKCVVYRNVKSESMYVKCVVYKNIGKMLILYLRNVNLY